MKRNKEPFWKHLKDFEFKTWYIAIIVVVAVLIRFWGENSITMLQKKIPIITSTEISDLEVIHYITTKQQYLDDNINITSDLRGNPNLEDILDKEIHEWFLVREWRPKRFFYVENRLSLILSCLHNQELMLNKADRLDREAAILLKSSADNITNKASGNAAKFHQEANNIRFYIDKELRQAGISLREENTVRTFQNNLAPLLDKDKR